MRRRINMKLIILKSKSFSASCNACEACRALELPPDSVVQLKEINCMIKQFLSKLLNKKNEKEKKKSLLKGEQFSFNARAYLFS